MAAHRLFLAATDFSEDAQHALERAALLAREQQVRLKLLHVVSEPSLQTLRGMLGIPMDIEARVLEQAAVRLDESAADLARRTGVEVEVEVRTGDIAGEILAEAEQADLLVMGARGSGGFLDAFVGSISERLLRRCRRPVLVVKRPPAAPYRRVLVPVAFGPNSLAALSAALLFTPRAETTVFHAFTVPYENTMRLSGVVDDDIHRLRDSEQRAALRRVDDLVAPLGTAAGRLRRSVEHGDPAHLILGKEKQLESDLIIIGKKGESALHDLLLGSVTRHVLSASQTDVMVVGEDMIEPRRESASEPPSASLSTEE